VLYNYIILYNWMHLRPSAMAY